MRPVASMAFLYFSMYTLWGLCGPYLPILLKDLGYRPGAIGLFMALYNGLGLLGPLAVGPLSDRLGRPRLVLGTLLSLVPLGLFSLAAWNYPWVSVVAVALLALGMWSMVPVSDSLASALGRDGGSSYGRVRSMGSLGFIVMALAIQFIPGLREESALSIASWSIAPICLTALAVALLRPRVPQGQGGGVGHRASPLLGKEPGIPDRIDTRKAIPSAFWPGLAIIALGRLGSIPFNGFLSLYMQEKVHWSAISGMWALGACAELPLIFVSGFLIRRHGLWPIILACLAAIALRLGIYVAFPVPAGVVGAQLLHSLCFGLFYPASVAFVSAQVPPERLSQGMGYNVALGMGLPNVLGNLFGGLMIEKLGYTAFFLSGMIPIALAIALTLAFYGRGLRRAKAGTAVR